jgi:hypothetical protein
MQCSNNMKQITLAMHVYHDALNALPPQCSTTQQNIEYVVTDISMTYFYDNNYRWSPTYLLLPFIEQTARFDTLKTDCTYPWDVTESTRAALSAVLCPSAPSRSDTSNDQLAVGNIVYCHGDGIADLRDIGADQTDDLQAVWSRGLIGSGRFNIPKGFGDITDGLSNTIAISEGVADDYPTTNKVKGSIAWFYTQRRVPAVTGDILWSPSRSQAIPRSGGHFTPLSSDNPPVRCGRYLDGATQYTGFNTFLPPNEVSATQGIGRDAPPGFYTAGSGHTNGVNCGRADGSVLFVTENVDTGGLPNAPQGIYMVTPKDIHPNFAHAPASSYGVWGAMGTPSAGETAALP